MAHPLRVLLLVVIFSSQAFGVVRTVKQTGNWSDTATWTGSTVPAKTDDADIVSPYTVTIDSLTPRTGPNDTTCRMVCIRSGATLTMGSGSTPAAFHPIALWGGGCGGAGGCGGNAGTFAMYQNDTLRLWDGNLCSSENRQDLYIGTAGTVIIQGSDWNNLAVVEGYTTGTKRPTWWIYNGDEPSTVTIQYAKFNRLGEANNTANSGLQWDDDPATFTFNHVILDSTVAYLQNFSNRRFNYCSVYVYFGQRLAWNDISGNTDTFMNFHFVVDHNNQSSSNTSGCMNLQGATSAYVDSSSFLALEAYTGGGGPRSAATAVTVTGGVTSKIFRCRVDSFMTPFTYQAWNSTRVGYCTLNVIGSAAFQHINWSTGADGNRFFGNYIAGTLSPATGIYLFEQYGTTAASGDSLDLVFAFNTVVPMDGNVSAGFLDLGSTGYLRPGVVFVGNILATEGPDVLLDTGITMRFRGWSSNAFNARTLRASAVIDSTTTAPGSANKNDSTYYFVDSAGYDFRLWDLSDLIAYTAMLPSDSDWCDSFFTSPNYNIGAYQGPGVPLILNNLPIGPETHIRPSVIGPRDRQ